jgi:hypothetical protein
MLSKAQLAVIVNLDFDEKIEPHEDDYISVLKSYRKVNHLVKRWKVSSADITNFDLLEYLKSTDKPIIISTGMSTKEQVDKAVEYLGDQIELINYCVSIYPCPIYKIDLRNIFLAIKGGSWKASSYTIDGNTLSSTTTVSDLPFFLKGISLIGRMTAQNAAGTATAQDRIGFGSGRLTTSRNSAGILDRNGTDPSSINTIVQYSSVLSFPSTAGGVQATYDIDAFNLNQFRIIVDTAGGVASEFHGYLAFGDQMYPRIQSVGHPFII